MNRPGSYHLKSESRDMAAELERLAAQIRICWEKEFRLLQWIGLKNGFKVLDAGSGPGYYTEKLTVQWPGAEITVLEQDKEMLSLSKEYLSSKGCSGIRFVMGSVYDTGLEHQYFDMIICRFVFQHLEDTQCAAAELKKLLKPGGKLVVIDIDAGLFGIVSPYQSGLEPIYRKQAEYQAKNGGDRLIGRRLWKILTMAGYHNVDLHSYVYHSDELGIKAFERQISADRFRPLLKKGKITSQEYDTLVQANKAFMSAEDSYLLMINFLAVGENIF